MNDRVDISESSIKDPSMNSFSAQEAVGKGERTPVVQALERILTPEQRQLIQTEKEIGLLGLDEHAKIILPRAGEDNDAVLAWKAKEGVLDAKSYQGVTMVIFNRAVIVPDGCPTQFKEMGRAGEYDAFSKTAFTDISNTWDFLHDRFNPSWENQNVRHELRHGVVSERDEQYHPDERRVVDQRKVRGNNPELARQLGYLDEVHSQYSDVLDGERQGHDAFRTINSSFYSIEARGTHPEVASTTPEGQQTAGELFRYLQGMILLKFMSEGNTEYREDIDDLTRGAATVLVTERSLELARDKVGELWKVVKDDASLKGKLETFLDGYTPEDTGNTPVVDEDLRQLLLNEPRP